MISSHMTHQGGKSKEGVWRTETVGTQIGIVRYVSNHSTSPKGKRLDIWYVLRVGFGQPSVYYLNG